MLSKEDLDKVLEIWTIDEIHLVEPESVDLVFHKYQRMVAFMEVYQRYIPEDTIVNMNYFNGAGVIRTPYAVIEDFAMKNKDTMEKVW